MTKPIISTKNISHCYQSKAEQLKILNDVSCNIYAGDVVSLIGPSGSGKTTFLQILGLLQKPTDGDVYILNEKVDYNNDKQITDMRAKNLGFIYQFHHLLPEFTALENVALPLLCQNINKNTAFDISKEMLELVNMQHRLTHRPATLSGGEKQRVAIARAMVNKPSLILADEPTGSLDPTTADTIINLFLSVAQKQNIAILLATHNMSLLEKTNRALCIDKGNIVELHNE